MIAWLNRQQNVSQLSFCDIKAGLCQTVWNSNRNSNLRPIDLLIEMNSIGVRHFWSKRLGRSVYASQIFSQRSSIPHHFASRTVRRSWKIQAFGSLQQRHQEFTCAIVWPLGSYGNSRLERSNTNSVRTDSKLIRNIIVIKFLIQIDILWVLPKINHRSVSFTRWARTRSVRSPA